MVVVEVAVVGSRRLRLHLRNRILHEREQVQVRVALISAEEGVRILMRSHWTPVLEVVVVELDLRLLAQEEEAEVLLFLTLTIRVKKGVVVVGLFLQVWRVRRRARIRCQSIERTVLRAGVVEAGTMSQLVSEEQQELQLEGESGVRCVLARLVVEDEEWRGRTSLLPVSLLAEAERGAVSEELGRSKLGRK